MKHHWPYNLFKYSVLENLNYVFGRETTRFQSGQEPEFSAALVTLDTFICGILSTNDVRGLKQV